MKSFKFIESSIIGLLIGVVVSVYILFMDTIGRDFGSILKTISLTHIVEYFPQNYKNSIIINFLFYIVVYTIYVVLFNFLFKIHKKSGIVLSVLLIPLIGISIVQQIDSFKKPLVLENSIVESGSLSANQVIKKYFGDEVKGDLNNDMRDDVAFLIKRNDGDERGDIYYLSASLKTDEGYEGLNLMYIGEKINIDKLEIREGIITVFYKEDIQSEEIVQYKAKVNEKILTQVEEIQDVNEGGE